MLEKVTTLDKLYLGLTAIALILNGALYSVLPDKIGIHQRGGEMDSYISKWMFLLLIPAIMTAYYFYSNKMKNESEKRRLVVGLVLILVNNVILFMNI